jgi:hypothetical protein
MPKSLNLKGIHRYLYLLLEALRDYQKCQFLKLPWQTASRWSLFVPLPVGGPDVRYYFAKNCLYVDENVKGMYFFGYRNFVSSPAKVGVALGRHVAVVGGYELGWLVALKTESGLFTIGWLAERWRRTDLH